MSAVKNFTPLRSIRIGLWDPFNECESSAHFERLLCEAGFSEGTLLKLAGTGEIIPSTPSKLDVMVLVVSQSFAEASCAALRGLRQAGMTCPLLTLSNSDSENLLLQLLEAGASDFLPLPLRKAEVLARLARWARPKTEVESVIKELSAERGLNQIVGCSLAILAEVGKLRHFARCDAAVLICGETGTGKEVFARAIHYLGARSGRPFLPVNCAALPVELVENELFGHESGAYTGARGVHPGLIQQAEGGTLFLDEIDSLPLPAQAKLLRFLQEREYRPLGAVASRQADVRVISASNHGLAAAARVGRFRQDLYYRLNVLALNLPPLRERHEDIPALANHLLARHSADLGRSAAVLSPAAMRQLMDYDWPGNIRELENVLERALVLSSGGEIGEENIDLPAAAKPAGEESFNSQKRRIVLQFERRYLTDALARNGGNITKAAKSAAKDRRTFFELVRKHGLSIRIHADKTIRLT